MVIDHNTGIFLFYKSEFLFGFSDFNSENTLREFNSILYNNLPYPIIVR